MNLNSRIKAFGKLGEYLASDFFLNHELDILHACAKNSWFSVEHIRYSINFWSIRLNTSSLDTWLASYSILDSIKTKKILLVLAGNIPLVGFHDFLSSIILGHKVFIKMSSKDNVLFPLIVSKLFEINIGFKKQIYFSDTIHVGDLDAVIATGSDHSARYFEYYFKDIKKIIRKNRTSIAILDGKETNLELEGLASDIFLYYGLGCRNVSKLLLPKDYDLDNLFNVFSLYSNVLGNNKYKNNYEYNRALLLMGNRKFFDNGFYLMKEEDSLFSPLSMIYYQFYTKNSSIESYINNNFSRIQCIVSNNHIPFGFAQKPSLSDYADNLDIIDFLISI